MAWPLTPETRPVPCLVRSGCQEDGKTGQHSTMVSGLLSVKPACVRGPVTDVMRASACQVRSAGCALASWGSCLQSPRPRPPASLFLIRASAGGLCTRGTGRAIYCCPPRSVLTGQTAPGSPAVGGSRGPRQPKDRHWVPLLYCQW